MATKYLEVARNAKQQEPELQTSKYDQCRDAGNALLHQFMRGMGAHFAENHPGMALSLGTAASSVKDHPIRLWNKKQLTKVVGVEKMTVQLVEKNLWALFPPEPPSEEEKAMQFALDVQEKAAKAQQRRDNAAQKSSSPTAWSAPTASGLEGASGSGPAAEALVGAAGGDPLEAEQPPAKKLKAADLPYVPKVGSANYAFLVALYIARHEGCDFLSKAELMQKAEVLGITNVSIYGAEDQGDNPFNYDGWSGFKTMKTRPPPLVEAWSCPLKVRLSAEGLGLAARLYKNGLASWEHLAVAGLDPDVDISACAVDWEPIIAAKGTKALAAVVAAAAAAAKGGAAPVPALAPAPAAAASTPAKEEDAAVGGGRGKGRGRGGKGKGRGKGRAAAARGKSAPDSDPDY